MCTHLYISLDIYRYIYQYIWLVPNECSLACHTQVSAKVEERILDCLIGASNIQVWPYLYNQIIYADTYPYI